MYNNKSLIKPKSGIQLNRAHPLAQGLVAYWPFNEGAGTVTRNVVSGEPGTLTNFALGGSSTSGWTGTKMGGGLRFDGSDDYVNIGQCIPLQSAVDYNKRFSVSFWFTLHTAPSSYHCLLGNAIAVSTDYDVVDFRLYINNVEFSFKNFGATKDGRDWRGAFSFEVNKLYNLVYVYDGLNTSTSLNCFINGSQISMSVSVDDGNITQSVWQSGRLLTKDMWIGRRNFSTGDEPFPGTIDSIRVYNRVLHTDEIKTLYTQPHIDFHRSKTKLLIK